MNNLYLAWRYVSFYRTQTFVLVASLTLIVFLPAGLDVVVRTSAQQLQSRAAQTPLVLGAKSSQLELVLNTLYFETEAPPMIKYHEAQRVLDSGYADAIPLHTRYRVDRWPLVGTTLDYFQFRDLRLDRGQMLSTLGDCVLGAEAARQLQVEPGDHVGSKAEGFVNIAGPYPLEMRVVGILAPRGTPDDRAVFVDLKTAWVIEGLGHGHQDVAEPEASDVVLERQGNRVTVNPKVFQYNRITPENIQSFHFHGDTADFPVSSLLILPHDSRSSDLLRGSYLGDEETVQLLRPKDHIEALLETVVKVRAFVLAGAFLVGVSTLLTFALVIVLSLKLRQRELGTMSKLGCSRSRILSFVGIELAIVVSVALITASLLVTVLANLGDEAIRWLLL